MAKRSVIEEKLKALTALEQAPITDDTQKELRRSLKSANSLLVAKAAEVVGRLGIKALVPDLCKAYDRFIDTPVKRDKGCMAKEAVITALDDLAHSDTEIFLRGIKYRQVEPGYMRSVDTAAMLRGKCGFALVRIGYPEVTFELVDLLTDPEPRTRLSAVKALTGLSSPMRELLLRMKAKMGDDETQVVGECLFTLMQVSPLESVGFVEQFLQDDDGKDRHPEDSIISEHAALALGESRSQQGFEILIGHRENSMNPYFQDMLLIPIALTRLDEAFDYLIDVIENGHLTSAVSATEAIRIFGNESHRRRIQNAVETRHEIPVYEAYATWNDEQR